jgi:hypothetical protein
VLRDWAQKGVSDESSYYLPQALLAFLVSTAVAAEEILRCAESQDQELQNFE